MTLQAEFDGKRLRALASRHLGSFHLDERLIRDGVWGFHDLFFNGIIRWRLSWVDLGCEPTDGEAVLSDFYRPGLNIVADQSIKWTISFSGGLTRLRSYLLRSSSQPSGKAPSIPTFLQSCTCVRHRSVRLVSGHFFHHDPGMRCVTHVHKHSHLRFVLLSKEAFFFRIYTSGQLWHHLFIFHDRLATTGFAAACVFLCVMKWFMNV